MTDIHKNNKVDVNFELGKITLRFGKIAIGIDRCELAEIAKDSIIIADHARSLKENGLISSTRYNNIIKELNQNIHIADEKCMCRKR